MYREGIRRLRRIAVLTLLVAAPIAPAAAQQASWHALPEGTMVAVRIPDARDFYEAIKARTRLGSVLLDDRRIDAVRRLILRDSQADWDKVIGGLAKLGLKPDDLLEIAAGEVGYAAATTRGDDPKFVGLAWAECGEAVAERCLAAIDKYLDQVPDAPLEITREKLDLAGVAAEHLVVPLVGPRHGTADLRLSFKFGEALGVAGEVAPAPGTARNEANVVLGRLHLIVGRRGDALLAAHVVAPESDGDKKADPAPAIEAVRGTFARFVEAHGSEGDDFVRRRMQTAGLAEALPDGVPLVEVVADAPAILEAIGGGAVSTPEAPSRDEFRRLVQSTGFDKLGPIAYRTSLDGNVLRSGFFASLPQPRAGVAGLVDQAPLASQPADWVAADVIAYQHLSFDFGSAYTLGAELVRKLSEKGDGGVAAFEAQVNAFLGVEPAAMLGSLGRTHTILTFTPAAQAAVGPGDEDVATTALALVWKVTDEPLWQRLVQKGSELSLRPVVLEQGFSGIRFDDGKSHAGWFVGDGYMVAAIGQGVAERTLSMLRNPPRGEGALVGSAIGRKAGELFPREEAIAFELTDGPTMFKYFNVGMKKALDEAKDEEARRLKEIWPTDKELEGAVGVGVSAITVNRNGVVYRSAAEMPPP